MDRICIVYWSGTGNTESMAVAMKEALDGKQVAVDLFRVSDFDLAAAQNYDGFLLGCPAMGAEVLEEDEFQPVYNELRGELKDKKIGLFGSYSWGSGEWMDTWEEDVKSAGGILYDRGLIINEMPDDEALAQCAAFATAFAEA